jgi:hypothetical protein
MAHDCHLLRGVGLLPWFVATTSMRRPPKGRALRIARHAGANGGLHRRQRRAGGAITMESGSGSGFRGFEGHAGCRRTEVRCDARFDRAGGADGAPGWKRCRAHVRDALAALAAAREVERSRWWCVRGSSSPVWHRPPNRPALSTRRAVVPWAGDRVPLQPLSFEVRCGRRLRQRRRASMMGRGRLREHAGERDRAVSGRCHGSAAPTAGRMLPAGVFMGQVVCRPPRGCPFAAIRGPDHDRCACVRCACFGTVREPAAQESEPAARPGTSAVAETKTKGEHGSAISAATASRRGSRRGALRNSQGGAARAQDSGR